MRNLSGRLAAAAVAGVLVAGNLGTNAVAESATTFDAGQCQHFTASEKAPQRSWHLDRLHMDDVWKIATGKGVTVAVIDTGASGLGSVYFPANTNQDDWKVKAWDYVGPDPEAEGQELFDCEHGTKVMALIAAARPDGQPADGRTDFAGIAPDARIISYRALRYSKAGDKPESLRPTIDAVRHATASGVDIINLSQSVGPANPEIEDYALAVKEAIDAGIVVVAAAGNLSEEQGITTAGPPATFPGVISVGMTNKTDAPDAASLPGQQITIGAPGVALTSLLPSNNIDHAPATNQAYAAGNVTGTSFAAPIVSGVVALIKEKHPDYDPKQIRQLLVETADPPSASGSDARGGYGMVNPMRALTGAQRPAKANPGAETTQRPDPYPTRKAPDMRPAFIGVGVGVGAVVLTLLGLVTAVALPPALRRGRERRDARRP